ncbi:competence protein [Streptococcus suis]
MNKITKELAESVLTGGISQLGVSSMDELTYDDGSFIINKELHKKFARNELSFDKTIIKGSQKLPAGCEVMLSRNTLSKTKRPNLAFIEPPGWDRRLNIPQGTAYIHRGHIIAHELFEDSSWKYDYKKKYFTQTVWSNQSSQNASQGKNQSYYEWYIKEKLMQDDDLEVNYRVKLIYEKNDIIPKGIHIRAVFMKKSERWKVVEQFNVFVPNVDPRMDIDYEQGKFIIKN